MKVLWPFWTGFADAQTCGRSLKCFFDCFGSLVARLLNVSSFEFTKDRPSLFGIVGIDPREMEHLIWLLYICEWCIVYTEYGQERPMIINHGLIKIHV